MSSSSSTCADPSIHPPHDRVVMLGRNRYTFEPVAVKEVPLKEDRMNEAVENEHNALSRLPTHRNIVQYKGCHRGRRVASLVFEYVPLPSVTKFLRQNGPLRTSEALFVIRQIVRFPQFSSLSPWTRALWSTPHTSFYFTFRLLRLIYPG